MKMPLLAFLLCCAAMLATAALTSGCATPAPADDTPFFLADEPTPPIDTDPVPEPPRVKASPCGNPNCTCVDCDGDCQCGQLTQGQREKMQAHLTRLESDLIQLTQELAETKKAGSYKPVKVAGVYYCLRNDGEQMVYRMGTWVRDEVNDPDPSVVVERKVPLHLLLERDDDWNVGGGDVNQCGPRGCSPRGWFFGR